MKKIKSLAITIILSILIITSINKIYILHEINKWSKIYSSENTLTSFHQISIVSTHNPKDIWYILSIRSPIPSFIDQDAIIIKSHLLGTKVYVGGRLSNFPSWDKLFVKWAIIENEDDPKTSIIKSIENQLKDKGFRESNI